MHPQTAQYSSDPQAHMCVVWATLAGSLRLAEVKYKAIRSI